MVLRYTRKLEFLVVIAVACVVCVAAEEWEKLELHNVIKSQCNNIRNCKVHLGKENYTLNFRFILTNDSFDSLVLIGEGYQTRVTCNKYFADKHENKKAIISVFGLKSVHFHRIHFHDCHPAKIIPIKLETHCPRKIHANCPTHTIPIPKHNKELYHASNYTKWSKTWEEHEFTDNRFDEWPHHLRDTTVDYQVNATIWIKDCYKVNFSFVSFNNFSYNAIQVTNTKITILSHMFLYSKSLYVSSGYHARGVLYEIKGNDQQFFNFTFNLSNSYFEDIATVSPETEFNVSNETIGRIKSHYGGAGAKVLILSAVHAEVNIDWTEFRSCSGLQGGGMLFIATEEVLGYTLRISNSEFAWNQAVTQAYLNPSGGALLIKQRTKNGKIYITNTWFRNNCANQGGAIGIDLDEYNQHHTVFHSEGNIFICNRANLGGAVYIGNIYHLDNECKFRNTSFEKNSANTGGAILGYNSEILLKNSSLSKNWGYLGGAIALISSKIRLGEDVSMVHNIAELKGGAFYLIAYSMIHVLGSAHVLIKENLAYYKGGGIYVFNNYVENNYYSWLSHIDLLKDIFCFITFRDHKHLSLKFENNKIQNWTNGPCMGSDLFTNTWGNCWSYAKRTSTLLNTNATNLRVVRKSTNCSVALDIVKYAKLDFINESLCYFNTSDQEHEPHCKMDIFNIDSFPLYKEKMRNEVKNAIEQFKNNRNVPPMVYVLYPGFETSIRIGSRDGLNQSILTDTVVLFEQIEPKTKYDIKFKFGGILTDSIVSTSSSRVNFSLTNSEDGWVNGKLCLKSELSLRVITYCIPVILAKCMPGFKIGADNSCQFTGVKYIKGSIGTTVTVHRNALMVVGQETKDEEPEDVFHYVHCTWFQCKCDSTGSVEECTFNVLKPQDQCKPWLKGKYCNESKMANQTLVPTYSFTHLLTNSYSFKCRAPWIMTILYFIICALILAFIIISKIDIFADYTRSITFYSGILLLLSIGCGGSGDELFQKLITIPILVLNLKLTHMYPFCMFPTNGVKRAIFELYAPLIFSVYTLIVYLCIHYLANSRIFKRKRFNDKIIFNQFWTIIILLYTNLCSGALLVFKCSVDSNNVARWILNGNIVCYVKEHMRLSIAAILIIFLLTVIPFLLIAISCAELKGKKHVVSLYEKRYLPQYKHWEPVKMFLRFIIALLLIIPEGFVNFNYPCIIVSVICLFLMVLTSLLKPSKNTYANHFESFCLLVLGITGIRVTSHYKEAYFNILLIFPYVIFLGIKGPKLLANCVGEVKQKLRKNKRGK